MKQVSQSNMKDVFLPLLPLPPLLPLLFQIGGKRILFYSQSPMPTGIYTKQYLQRKLSNYYRKIIMVFIEIF